MCNSRSRKGLNDCEQPCKPKRKTLGICLGGSHARPNLLSSFIHSAFVAWRLGGLLGSATGSGPREGSGGATFPPSPTQLTSATSWQSHRFWNFNGVIDHLINKAGKVEGKEKTDDRGTEYWRAWPGRMGAGSPRTSRVLPGNITCKYGEGVGLVVVGLLDENSCGG
jgi:hypothetical protein